MTKFGEVLKEARLELNLTQLEVANRIGRTQAYYNRIENGKVPPSFDILERLAKVLKCDLSKLHDLADKSRLLFKQRQIDQQHKALGIRPSNIRPIPILSEIPAGHPKDYTDQDYPPGIAEEYYEFKIEDPDAFFLRAEGDCMAPEIKDGDLLLIYPNDKIKTGDIVIVRNNKEEKEVRRITIQPDQIILTAENPIYPVRVWRKKDKPKIIGRVKEIIRRR